MDFKISLFGFKLIIGLKKLAYILDKGEKYYICCPCIFFFTPKNVYLYPISLIKYLVKKNLNRRKK